MAQSASKPLTLGEKIERDIRHYRKTVVDSAPRIFDKQDLENNIDDVMARMVEIMFEQINGGEWKGLIEEAARDCEVKEN